VLVRSEKQAAQGALVPVLAHNIRNPLASIRATAQVVDDPALENCLSAPAKATTDLVHS
jgi:nitrogen-specific signal transduction histidine kinase